MERGRKRREAAGGVSPGTPVTRGRERSGNQWWRFRRSCWEAGEREDRMGPQRPHRNVLRRKWLTELMLLVHRVGGELGMDLWV